MTRARERTRARSVDEEYAQLAPVYDERWAAYVEGTVELSLARIPEKPYERILDVGCGTGAMLEPLAARFATAAVYGIDPSRAMLDVARSRLPARIGLAAAYAEALPFRAGCFDLLASISALHYFSDPHAAAAEMYRVVRPGGSVLITDWCDDFLTMKTFDRVMRLLGKANFTTLSSKACSALLRDAGFERVRVEPRRVGAFWGVMIAIGEKPVPDVAAAQAD